MFDFATVKKIQLVDMVRAAQEATGSVMSAASTLLRMKPDQLVEKIASICGDTHEVDESGSIVPVDTGLEFDPTVELVTDSIDYTQTDTVEKIDEEAETEMQSAAEPVPADAPKSSDLGVITVLATDKKFRDGSDRAAYFACFRSGQTVAEYLLACTEKAVGSKGRRALRKAIAKGFVTVTQPSSEG